MYKKYSKGMIEVITGPMFAGKSEEFIKRINQLGFAKIKTLVVKPDLDTRWSKNKVKSRSGVEIKTKTVKNAQAILDLWNHDFQVIAIDEAQFFDNALFEVVEFLANQKVRVIVSGLDTDFEGKPFGPLPKIMAVAEKVSKETAVCVVCGNAATKTYRKTGTQNQLQIGDQEYEARCRVCHAKRN